MTTTETGADQPSPDQSPGLEKGASAKKSAGGMLILPTLLLGAMVGCGIAGGSEGLLVGAITGLGALALLVAFEVRADGESLVARLVALMTIVAAIALCFHFYGDDGKSTSAESLAEASVHADPSGPGKDLSNSVLPGVDLTGKDLAGANLAFADLKGARIKETVLDHARLVGANLASANLSGAKLRSADLSGANLRSACLKGADLTGANLAGADLTGAHLRDAILAKVLANQTTLWPELALARAAGGSCSR